MSRDTLKEAPIGGLYRTEFRNAILFSINDLFKERELFDFSNKFRMKLKNYANERFLSRKSEWRRYLAAALGFAEVVLDEVAEAFEGYYGLVVDLYFRLLEKGLVGTGSGEFRSLVEVGLSVDPLMGLPFYPGSTLKGGVRAVAEEFLSEDVVRLLFGSVGGVGSLVFADSYPVGCWRGRDGDGGVPCLVVTGDVVTPHYFVPGEGIVGAEYEAKPNPVFHLALAPGTVFRVVVGIDVERLGEDGARVVVEDAVRAGLLGAEAKSLEGFMGVGVVAARLVAAALASGIAARSGKGYNVMVPVDPGEVSREMIVGFRFRSENREGGGRGGGRRRR